MELLDRFLRYVSYPTPSDEHSETCPSTEGQRVLGRLLVDELTAMGARDAHMDTDGYVYAVIPANRPERHPVIGRIAHMDTSPDCSGEHIRAAVVPYPGGDLTLNEAQGIVLSPADYVNHIDKQGFTVPFVCGATNLGEALRRIAEGAAMIRSKGEAGTGDVSEATKHIRTIRAQIAELQALYAATPETLYVKAKELAAPYDIVLEVARNGKLPVVLFTAGGVATPADAAMMMQLGADGVFVGSGIFKSGDPARRAAAIVKATAFYDDAAAIAQASRGLGEAMVGINVADLPAPHRLAERGW